MKSAYTLIFFLSFSYNCVSQLISTKPVEINMGPTNFNPEAIKQNKIKKIDMVIVDKPDGEVIIDKGASQGYEFDTTGRLTRYYYTILNSAEREVVDIPAIKRKGRIIRPATTKTITKYFNDTIFAKFFYDSLSRIILKRIRTGDYYDAFYYEYNELGKIKKEIHIRETNVNENKNEFTLGVQNVLSTETFEYTTLTPTQIKKSCLNDEGREYKKAIINYDDRGNKISERYDFIVSWMRQEYIYQYDPSSRLVERTSTSNISGEIKEYIAYQYDISGLLTEEKQFKNDILLFETSYLYDDATKMIKSKISRDHKNSSIGIVKFGYTFY